jgi:hypothetical protein
MGNRIAKPEAARKTEADYCRENAERTHLADGIAANGIAPAAPESEADRRRRHAYKNNQYLFIYGRWGRAFDQAAVNVFPGSVPNPCGAPRPANPDGSINPDLYIPPANS